MVSLSYGSVNPHACARPSVVSALEVFGEARQLVRLRDDQIDGKAHAQLRAQIGEPRAQRGCLGMARIVVGARERGDVDGEQRAVDRLARPMLAQRPQKAQPFGLVDGLPPLRQPLVDERGARRRRRGHRDGVPLAGRLTVRAARVGGRVGGLGVRRGPGGRQRRRVRRRAVTRVMAGRVDQHRIVGQPPVDRAAVIRQPGCRARHLRRDRKREPGVQERARLAACPRAERDVPRQFVQIAFAAQQTAQAARAAAHAFQARDRAGDRGVDRHQAAGRGRFGLLAAEFEQALQKIRIGARLLQQPERKVQRERREHERDRDRPDRLRRERRRAAEREQRRRMPDQHAQQRDEHDARRPAREPQQHARQQQRDREDAHARARERREPAERDERADEPDDERDGEQRDERDERSRHQKGQELVHVEGPGSGPRLSARP
ncbi:sciS domain protein [Burkholderia pseudomallei MSHR449]|nr:sciS domain protein [Burkholderia pseudomallei MSHR449]